MNSPPFSNDVDAAASPSPEARRPFVLAAIGAGLASLYWAGLTALIAFAVAVGPLKGTELILPFVLIGLYAWRGSQILKGDPNAARSVLYLHVFGGLTAVFQIVTGGPLMWVLQGIKLVIHIFGSITAHQASKAPRLSTAPLF
ncbi:MAG TPA: hypothetical protein PKA58_09400 [Polyangium sp.]|nr:hypothetical protein [Polyangium sp.]